MNFERLEKLAQEFKELYSEGVIVSVTDMLGMKHIHMNKSKLKELNHLVTTIEYVDSHDYYRVSFKQNSVEYFWVLSPEEYLKLVKGGIIEIRDHA